MPKIEFSENKILSLTNVISKEYPANKGDEDRHINMLLSYIQSKNIKTKGPLILYSSPIMGEDKDGKPIQFTKVMIQCQDKANHNVLNPYIWEGDIRIENTLYARINDLPERAVMATFKLSVYAYENDLELGGDSYQILVNEDKETKKVILDLFMPLKKNQK